MGILLVRHNFKEEGNKNISFYLLLTSPLLFVPSIDGLDVPGSVEDSFYLLQEEESCKFNISFFQFIIHISYPYFFLL